jgi:hypothetical protein
LSFIRDKTAKRRIERTAAFDGAPIVRSWTQERPMPLTRDRIVGYDAGRMIFEFTMMLDARIVDCEISSTALDDLAGEKGVGERDAQFRRLRDAIEQVACRLFEESGAMPGQAIRIFSKHVKNR